MGLVAPLSTGGIPEKSESGDRKISTNDIATATRDTFINRTAIAPQTYPDVYGTLLQYTEGVPTSVEYFKKRGPYINNQSIDTSFSMERAAIHFSFDLIHDLEIRIKDQLEVTIDSETTETSIVGTAIIYPGFKPNVGDIFYMRLPDNNIGVFLVNLTEPLSIYRGSYYQINFHLDSNLTEVTDLKLRESVTDEFFYTKQHYFSDEAALLTHESYNTLEALLRHKKSIISHLMHHYYHTGEKTLIREGIYDPFLIEYLQNKISIRDHRRDLCQITNPFTGNFENTIWSAFLYQDVSILLYIGYTLHFYRQFIFDVNMSNIDHFKMISLIDPNKPFSIRLDPAKFQTTDTSYRSVNYIFSDRFYYALLYAFELNQKNIDITEHLLTIEEDKRFFENLSPEFYSFHDNAYHTLSFFDTHSKLTGSNNDMHLPEWEYLVYDFIVNDKVDTEYLIEKVLAQYPFIQMSQHDRLYCMSILLHLIDYAIKKIR